MSTSQPSPKHPAASQDEVRRILNLELQKARSEASAARLEAKSLEIELRIRKIGSATDPVADRLDPWQGFSSWEEVREAIHVSRTWTASGTRAEDPPSLSIASIDPEREIPAVSLDTTDQAIVDRVAENLAQQAEEGVEEERQRRKPAAWLVSMVAHVAVLFLLAALGIQTQRPKDQVAFTASVSESEESSMESFTIETAKLELEPQETTEETPVEVEYELSPVGTLQAAKMSDVSPVMNSSMAASLRSQVGKVSAKPMSMKAESASKMKFCGVEGGGNHFVYLVDSSGSMKDGFDSARRALLSSIELLNPQQRFYVIFFDAKPDFMRIANPAQDDVRSVHATAENKVALRRWAMGIQKDRGRAPYDPLRFALELKPDVIFLLSDGEFPEGILKLLKEKNRIENLFGEVRPISILHTIGYHSKEGASIMKRIATQNQGQYRYVPKP